MTPSQYVDELQKLARKADADMSRALKAGRRADAERLFFVQHHLYASAKDLRAVNKRARQTKSTKRKRRLFGKKR